MMRIGCLAGHACACAPDAVSKPAAAIRASAIFKQYLIGFIVGFLTLMVDLEQRLPAFCFVDAESAKDLLG
jgi:hypothetical protein